MNKVLMLLNEMQLEYIRLPGAKYQPQCKKGKKKNDLKKMGVVETEIVVWNTLKNKWHKRTKSQGIRKRTRDLEVRNLKCK